MSTHFRRGGRSPLCRVAGRSARDEEGALTGGRRPMLACRQCLQHAGPASVCCRRRRPLSRSLVVLPRLYVRDRSCRHEYAYRPVLVTSSLTGKHAV